MLLNAQKIQELEEKASAISEMSYSLIGVHLSEAKALDLLAVSCNYNNWADLSSKVNKPSPFTVQQIQLRAYMMWKTAYQFMEAASRANKTLVVGEKFVSCPLPAVTMAAFSIESAFKSIILSETKKEQSGHELHKLFQKVPPNSQDKIKAMTDVPSYPHRETFESALKSVSNAFVHWRYIHQSSGELSADFSFLIGLAGASVNVARSLLPESIFQPAATEK